MSFKDLYIWEAKNIPQILEKQVKLLTEKELGINLCIRTKDAYYEKYFLNIVKNYFKNHKNYNDFGVEVILGNEITMDLLEDKFLSLDLFATKKIFLFLEIDKILEKYQDHFIEIILKQKEHVVISTTQKTSKKGDFLDQFFKSNIIGLKVNEPKPWEEEQVLRYLCKEFSLNLGPGAFNYLFNNIENDLSKYVGTLRNLKLHMLDWPKEKQTQPLSESDIKHLVASSKNNSFELLNSYLQKDKDKFLHMIIGQDYSLSEGLALLGFFKSQLLKLLNKDKVDIQSLKKYEKTFFAIAKDLTKKDIQEKIFELEQFEINFKSQSPFLTEKFKLDLLRLN